MQTTIYYSLWIWAITNFGMPLFSFGRIYFSLAPVLIKLTFEEKLIFYSRLKPIKVGITIFYFIISLIISFSFGTSVIRQDNLFYFLVILLINVIVQIAITKIIESKMPYTLKEDIKNMFNKNFTYYPKSEFKNTEFKIEIPFKESVLDKLDVIKKMSFQQKEVSELIVEKLSISVLPFKLKNIYKGNIELILEIYGISKKSKDDVIDFLNGKFPKNVIIFSKIYSGKINKQTIFDFFNDNFFLLNDKKTEWVLPQKDILNFINSNIKFEADDNFHKELNETINIIDKDTLSRYKKK